MLLSIIKNLYNSNDVDNPHHTFIILTTYLRYLSFYPLPTDSWLYSLYYWIIFFLFICGFPIGQSYYIYMHFGEVGFVEIIAKNAVLFESIIVVFKVMYMKKNIFKIQQLIEDLNKDIFKVHSDEQRTIAKQGRALIYHLCLFFSSSVH